MLPWYRSVLTFWSFLFASTARARHQLRYLFFAFHLFRHFAASNDPNLNIYYAAICMRNCGRWFHPRALHRFSPFGLPADNNFRLDFLRDSNRFIQYRIDSLTVRMHLCKSFSPQKKNCRLSVHSHTHGRALPSSVMPPVDSHDSFGSFWVFDILRIAASVDTLRLLLLLSYGAKLFAAICSCMH